MSALSEAGVWREIQGLKILLLYVRAALASDFRRQFRQLMKEFKGRMQVRPSRQRLDREVMRSLDALQQGQKQNACGLVRVLALAQAPPRPIWGCAVVWL